jgi:hypothetical protein
MEAVDVWPGSHSVSQSVSQSVSWWNERDGHLLDAAYPCMETNRHVQTSNDAKVAIEEPADLLSIINRRTSGNFADESMTTASKCGRRKVRL